MVPTSRPVLAAGLLLVAVAVAAGAFGAHGLARRLDARSLELWETASRYLMYGGLGLALLGVAGLGRGPALMLGAGSLVFAGTVGALALGAPRWLGAVTPIGGVLMIVGLVAAAWSAWRG